MPMTMMAATVVDFFFRVCTTNSQYFIYIYCFVNPINISYLSESVRFLVREKHSTTRAIVEFRPFILLLKSGERFLRVRPNPDFQN